MLMSWSETTIKAAMIALETRVAATASPLSTINETIVLDLS
jgi:hypothetical protein